ncbi:hypothetical protein EDEG_00097 [Edhazardia aedis USNM 41457]|uniref:Alanine--tRNA ligase n=1 Tax=Edhazardia aedis (strain USNM 41457) TaxID=1003232 RepID=J9DQX9_EDHAE|nr:hypothetical protein EDEG_00097 [Edhazardia aedis USNM 41457]|eukprot:EJW04980.1 hypothetical protein EDEG_00097 [Edhazardia aedis USNM 41457]
MKAEELTKLFLDYFTSRNHLEKPSSSVVPHDDDTLLFVNSGMVQFKKNFCLTKNELQKIDKEVCTVQHCIRAGGKHNDLDDVGKDGYHHTYFQMLGNWSFGSYFKREAIYFAYDFLVNILKLDKKRLYVTVFDSSCDSTKSLNFVDLETESIWKNYFGEDRILRFGSKDNFWEMGDSGPCGPCTEIHYDQRENVCEGGVNGADLVNKDHPEVIEIWNVVFIEYYRNESGDLTTLPVKSVDTGMGLERVLRIVNNVRSNYLTSGFMDLIQDIIIKSTYNQNKGRDTLKNIGSKDSDLNRNIEKMSISESKNKKSSSAVNDSTENKELSRIIKSDSVNVCINAEIDSKLYSNDIVSFATCDHENANTPENLIYYDCYNKNCKNFHYSMSCRVLADHARALAICIFYDCEFSSIGRGYVIRRILRRAIRFCNEIGIINKFHLIVKKASETLGINVYEKLYLIENEEKLFLKTLENGKKMFNTLISQHQNVNKKNKINDNCENKKINGQRNGIDNIYASNTDNDNNVSDIGEKKIISGKDAFVLYDTYGFPIDLTLLMAEEKGFTVDIDEFNKIQAIYKIKSKKAKSKDLVFDMNCIKHISKFETTQDDLKYTAHHSAADVLCVFKNNNVIYEYNVGNNHENSVRNFVDNVTKCGDLAKDDFDIVKQFFPGTENIESYRSKIQEETFIEDKEDVYAILLDQTCFYAESGGQIGDSGSLVLFNKNSFAGKSMNSTRNNPNVGIRFDVFDTQKYNGYVIHFCRLPRKTNLDVYMPTYKNKNTLKACVHIDQERREKIKLNHTATHILNTVLRNVLKDSKVKVEQRGSLVTDTKLRFDFSSTNITLKQIKEIEDQCNSIIENSRIVKTEHVNLNDFLCESKKENTNLIYLPGEKYPEKIRVVSIEGISSEPCGGTHATHTSLIRKMRIISETSISANTRRIVAVTNDEAFAAEENARKNNLDADIPLLERHRIINEQKEINKQALKSHKILLKKYETQIKSLISLILDDKIGEYSSNHFPKKQPTDQFEKLNPIEELQFLYFGQQIFSNYQSREISHFIAFLINLNKKNNQALSNIVFFFVSLNNKKTITKDLNTLAVNFDNSKINGCVISILDTTVFYSFKGKSATLVAQILTSNLKDASFGGVVGTATGYGTFE